MCLSEFIDVGKKQRALDALYDVIKSKRHRTWQKIHEPIMEKYLDLCVELKKSHIAKEGLYQYKNICQQVSSAGCCASMTMTGVYIDLTLVYQWCKFELLSIFGKVKFVFSSPCMWHHMSLTYASTETCFMFWSITLMSV